MKDSQINIRVSAEDKYTMKGIKDIYLEHGIVLRPHRHGETELSMSEVIRRLIEKHNQVLRSNKLTDAFCLVCLASEHCPGKCKLLKE